MKKRQRKHITLNGEFGRIFRIAILIPFLAAVVGFLFLFGRIMQRSYVQRARQTLQSMSSHLDGQIDDLEMYFYEYLWDDSSLSYYSYVDFNDTRESAERGTEYMYKAAKYRESIQSRLTVNEKFVRALGFVPSRNNSSDAFLTGLNAGSITIRGVEGRDQEDFLEQVRESRTGTLLYGTAMPGVAETADSFTIGRKLLRPYSSRTLGCLFLQVSDEFFREVISSVELENGAAISIRYPDGSMAYLNGTNEELEHELQDCSREIRDGKLCVGGESYYSITQETRRGFTINYLIPSDVIIQEVFLPYFFILVMFLVAIVTGYILYQLLFRRIEAYTQQLVACVSHYPADENPENQYGVIREDPEKIEDTNIEELHLVGESVADMIGRTNQLINEQYVLKIQQQQAEYRALQAEINPHFFNNVLTSLIALNRLGDRKTLEKMLLQLSVMTRYSSRREYDSDLNEELSYLESYLALEKLRFEEKLEYSFDIEDDVRSVRMPRMLLQPIVENAIRHGFDGVRTMHIRIEAAEIQEKGRTFVLIIIANDGKPVDIQKAMNGKGVGIANVRDRLTLTYPDSFLWFSRTEAYSTVCNILFIPGKPAG